MKDKVKENCAYYNRQARAFFENTVDADVKGLYASFVPLIPNGGHILDFGCGSGRDSLYFLQKGYQVTALDGSEKLCGLAQYLIGQLVRQQDFFEFDDCEMYEGIWACASLLHISEKDLPEIIGKLNLALKPKGIIFASFKYGKGERFDNGRHFTDMDEAGIQKLFNSETGFVIRRLWQTSDVREGREDEKWIDVIAEKG